MVQIFQQANYDYLKNKWCNRTLWLSPPNDASAFCHYDSMFVLNVTLVYSPACVLLTLIVII